MEVKKGSTNVTTYVKLVDETTGDEETGYTITNLDLQYVRNQSTPSTKVDAVALAATNTAHTDNRAIEVDSTDQPGLYRVDWPDAAFATGVDKVILSVKGAGLDTVHIHVDLVDNVAADILAVLGALNDAAAAGDPTSADTVMQYIKQLINVLVGTSGVGTFPAEAAPGNGVSLAEVIRAIHADVTGLNGDAMRGTDNAALASVLGALADSAAAGDPTSADTLMQYTKQLINILVGTTGVTTFPAEAGPANNVSLAEIIRAIHSDVTGLNGDAMRGTDNAALASVLGALADAAAAGDPTSADTIMQYVKQLINILVGTAGVTTYPAAADPGNGVSLAEVVREIHGRLPAALVGGRMDSDVAVLQTDVISAAALSAAGVDKIRDGLIPTQNVAFSFDFLMVDSTDHVTPEPSLTITATRNIDGAGYGAATGSITNLGNGTYQFAASQADMNGAKITFRFTATGADDKFITIYTGGAV